MLNKVTFNWRLGFFFSFLFFGFWCLVWGFLCFLGGRVGGFFRLFFFFVIRGFYYFKICLKPSFNVLGNIMFKRTTMVIDRKKRACKNLRNTQILSSEYRPFPVFWNKFAVDLHQHNETQSITICFIISLKPDYFALTPSFGCYCTCMCPHTCTHIFFNSLSAVPQSSVVSLG